MSLSQPNLRKPTGLNFSDFTKAATKPAIPLASSNTTGPDIKFPFNLNSQSTGTLKINGEEFVFKAEDLEDQGEIGRGVYQKLNANCFYFC